MPLPPYHRPRARPFAPPTAIRRLPLNLQRTHLYPRDPARVASAVQEYYRYMSGQPMPAMLPQRMLFQQNKSYEYGPVGDATNWARPLSSASSWSALQQQYTHGVPNRIARKVPAYPHYTLQEAAAARGANMMPQARLSQHLTPVVARQVRQNNPTSRLMGRAEPPPSAWAAASEITGLRAHRARLIEKEAALSGARAAVVRSRGYVRR